MYYGNISTKGENLMNQKDTYKIVTKTLLKMIVYELKLYHDGANSIKY